MDLSYIYYSLPIGEKFNDVKLKDGYHCVLFIPKIIRLNLVSKFNLIYLFRYILTLGKYRIYYVFDNVNSIVHYSVIMPKFYKYKFINRRESFLIGPCWTHKKHRGLGIYPSVLGNICRDFQDKNLYIFTEVNNISSQKGIEKVGFKEFGRGCKTKFLGIYRINY